MSETDSHAPRAGARETARPRAGESARPRADGRAAAERLRALEETLAAARIGTFDWDLAADTVRSSRNAARIVGVARLPADIDGYLARIHPADREPLAERLRAVLDDSGSSWLQVEYRVEGDDGRLRWIRGQGRVRRDAAGRPLRVMGTIHDVSDRKALETQLFQSQKMESIGQLAGGVAHDFNNLLTAIFGEIELARDDVAEGSPLAESFDAIEQAAERARRLTGQLLAFARRQVFELQVCDLGDRLRELSDLLERVLDEGVRLDVRAAPGLWRTRIDVHQMEQVLLNLAVNAREAMPEGGTLVFEAANRADGECPIPGDHVLLAVRDTGSGMPESIRLRALEPFFTTRELGTGLGLSTCYGIVEQLGGHLTISSELGRGTEVRIYLPRFRGEEERAPAGHDAAREGAVLVVEDEAAVRSMTARGLRKHGYTVIEATHGAEALAHVRDAREPVAVLVTDVVMPGLSGRELAERVVALSPETRVLFVSGHAEEVIGRHGLAGVESGFLQKPYTPVQIADRIRALLDAPALPVSDRGDAAGEGDAAGRARSAARGAGSRRSARA